MNIKFSGKDTFSSQVLVSEGVSEPIDYFEHAFEESFSVSMQYFFQGTLSHYEQIDKDYNIFDHPIPIFFFLEFFQMFLDDIDSTQSKGKTSINFAAAQVQRWEIAEANCHEHIIDTLKF